MPSALGQKRTYVAAWKALRIGWAPWRAEHWSPERRLARAAIRRGAAQKIRELTAMIALVQRRPPQIVVEIGTDLGGTLFIWCRLATPTATIISVDLPGAAFGRSEAVKAAPSLAGYAAETQALHLLHLDSHSTEARQRVETLLDGRQIDLLMIDGDHTYTGVKADFELYSPLVSEGGLIVFHDILPNEVATSCDVDRFWVEIRGAHTTHEFTDRYDDRGVGQWGGLGVIEWSRPETA